MKGDEFVPKEGEIVLVSNEGGDNPRDWYLMYFCNYQFDAGGLGEGYVCSPEESWETYGNHAVYPYVKPVTNQAQLNYIAKLERKVKTLQKAMTRTLKILKKAANV